MARSRTILIAGAGIGGLTLALALAKRGFRSIILEQSDRLEAIGAGIQLSPNATRILIDLGLRGAIERVVVAPEAIRIRSGISGAELIRAPLGAESEFRYGAPFWVVHRGDLQSALLNAARSNPSIALRLGAKVEDFAIYSNGVTVQARSRADTIIEHGIALVGADGVWSSMRARLGQAAAPRFAGRSAWRAMVPSDLVASEQRQPVTSLWLGPDAHLVHYPVRAGRMINVVAIVEDTWQRPGWTAPGARSEITARFARWAPAARALLETPPDAWTKWALFEQPATRRWGKGRITLLGDAAHSMLPFLAQGGAMAIEDAAVLAACLAQTPDDAETAFKRYQGLRRIRTARVSREAGRNGRYYHLSGAAALARNLSLRLAGGASLIRRYDWLYDWRP